MPSRERHKTQYPGVCYVMGRSIAVGKPERVYYITYRRDGRLIEEKAGRAVENDMTPARAAQLRSQRIAGAQESNKARGDALRAAKEAEAGRWTIQRLWDAYRANKPNWGTDENRYNLHLKERFGDKEPKDLAPLDIDLLRVGLLKRRSPQTTKHVLTLLKRIVNFGVNKGLCPGLGFRPEMPRVNNVKTEDLTPDQLAGLLKAIEENPCDAGAMMQLALCSGMRRGEMFKLKWQDIDARGFIRIRNPKDGPDQTIPLNDIARALLEGRPRTSPYVFPGRSGGQRTDIKRQANRVKEEAGLPKDFRPLHGLRHVYASMLASSGQVDMYTLQRLLTHKSPIMTRRYALLRDESLRRAADTAGDLIAQAMSKKEEAQGEQAQEAQAG